MTVNSSRTTEYNIDQLVLTAHRLAGLAHISQDMTTEQGAWGRQLLELTMKHLETLGVQVRVREFVEVTMVVGTDRYELEADVLNVTGAGAYIREDEPDIEHASSELQVTLIDHMQWQQLSAKSAEGNPTLCYVHRAGALVEIRLWPTPTEAGTLRLPVQLLYPDSTDGNKTPGTERPWAQYLTYELAWQLAESGEKSREKIGSLQGVAAQKLKECRGFSQEKVPYQMQFCHPVGRGR